MQTSKELCLTGSRLIIRMFTVSDTAQMARIFSVILPQNGRLVRVAGKLGFAQRESHLHGGLKHRYFVLQQEDNLQQKLPKT